MTWLSDNNLINDHAAFQDNFFVTPNYFGGFHIKLQHYSARDIEIVVLKIQKKICFLKRANPSRRC